MRILGFSKKWPKLKQSEFTTFRLRRRDKDWQVGELVQVVFKPRSKFRESLGTAEIVNKEPRHLHQLSHDEAVADGFRGVQDMTIWLLEAHGKRMFAQGLNKLTVRWVNG